MTDCPSIRPSLHDMNDKIYHTNSYLHNVKPRDLCTFQFSWCKNAVAPYAQLSVDNAKDTDLSCGSDAGISTVLDDIAEPGEVACDQGKDATCAPACTEVEATAMVEAVPLAVVSQFKAVDNTITAGTTKNDTPSDLFHQK